MKKLVALLVGFAVIIIVGKLYLEHAYKKELDKALLGASLFAEVVYQDLKVGYDGSIDLLGLSITPNNDINTISFSSIKVSGFDLLFHFNGKSRVAKGDFPKMLNLDIKQIRFPASIYDEAVKKDKMECRSIGGTMLYSSAGFDEVSMNTSLKFDFFDPSSTLLNLSFSDQLSSGTLSMTFDSYQVGMNTVMAGGFPVDNIQYDITLDNTAAESIIEHCAAKFKLSKEDYLNKIVNSNVFMFNSVSHTLGDKANEGLAKFLEGGSKLSVSATPSDRLKNGKAGSKLSASQILRMLNLNVSLDDVAIPLSLFSSAQPNRSDSSQNNDSDDGFKRRDLDELMYAPDGTVQERVKPQLSKQRKSKYKKVSLSQVNNHLYKLVKVSRTGGKSSIEGQLISVKGDVLSITSYLHGGEMTLTIPYDDVAKIEIAK